MKLRNKINLYTAFLFALLLILMNITIYLSFNKLILDSELSTANKEIEKVTENIGKSLGAVPEGALLRSYVPINGMIRLVSPDNERISAVTSPTEQELSKQKAVFYNSELSKTIEYINREYIFSSMPIIMPDGTVANLQITKSLKTAANILSILRIVLFMVTLLALIPVLISSRVLSNLITKPVSSMINTMTDIRQSGRFKRLKLEGNSKDELFLMGETFNHMIDLLEVNFEKQEQFVSNASHELKTPLTIIESYASLLKRRGKEEPKLFTEAVEAIHSEAIRMKDMTEQLLMLAKNNEQWDIEKSQINLKMWIQHTIKGFADAYQRKIEMVEGTPSPIMIETDEKKLKQLIFIFLDNARKYSDDIIKIEIGTNYKDDVYIKIIDRGIGIPPEELSKVFDRFYRVDKARTRRLGGTGLGLSIAKDIADAINAEIQLSSEAGRGTTATISLKKS
nr:HAMP domain-containing sensor histidine kinase [Neobacillus sp. Marseille-Q6967]